MKTLKLIHSLVLASTALVVSISSVQAAHAGRNKNEVSYSPLTAFRDDLFTNRGRRILEEREKGAVVLYDWNYQESVLDRDAVEGEVAKPERIDTEVTAHRVDRAVSIEGQKLEFFSVGAEKNANFVVIFIHGAGGTKDIGASDVRFGANFNHIQSLALRNNGLYLSPTLPLDMNGGRLLAGLIEKARESSPKSKVILACGSAGAALCNVAAASDFGRTLNGLIYLGGSGFPENFASLPAARAKVPVLFSHGSKDPLVPLNYAEHFFSVAQGAAKNYPARLEIFNGGKHGTPIRLIDWKSNLEWMLNQAD